MSRTRKVPSWASVPRVIAVPPQAKPLAPGEQRASSTIAERRLQANAAREASPEYQQQLAEQAAQRERQNQLEQARIAAMAPTLTVPITFEDGTPVLIDGKPVHARVKAEDVRKALDAQMAWDLIPDSRKQLTR
jgi:hypothetical protein